MSTIMGTAIRMKRPTGRGRIQGWEAASLVCPWEELGVVLVMLVMLGERRGSVPDTPMEASQ